MYARIVTFAVRYVQAQDAPVWASLYTGYRAFYDLPDDPAAVRQTWQWILTQEHGLFGLVAANPADEPIALANLRWFIDPTYPARGLFLDDLFTAPEARQTGAAQALLRRAAEIAAEGGANVVRWITASDNTTARRLYDRVATATEWVTYEMNPASSGSDGGS